VWYNHYSNRLELRKKQVTDSSKRKASTRAAPKAVKAMK
jgi:hypothetical protein